jgi:hypothetical protein
MKIDNVEAIPIEIPLNKVFSGSGYHVASRNTIFELDWSQIEKYRLDL